jgi:hypothetical protein
MATKPPEESQANQKPRESPKGVDPLIVVVTTEKRQIPLYHSSPLNYTLTCGVCHIGIHHLQVSEGSGDLMRTTFPQLLLNHAAQRPDAAAMREKEYGIWQTTTWAAMKSLVQHMACGLHQAGLHRV